MNDNYFTRETLLLRLRDSYDEKSWEEFVKYYRGYIFTVIHRSGLNYEDAQDTTQDVLLKAWKALPQFEYKSEECKFRSWLMIVCRNCLRDYAKSSRGKLSKLQVSSDDDEIHVLCASTEAEIDAIAEIEWKMYIAHLAWESISTEFSANVLEAFYMHSEEYSTDEIRDKLDICEENIYVYRGRVRKALLKETLRLETQLG